MGVPVAGAQATPQGSGVNAGRVDKRPLVIAAIAAPRARA